MQCERCEQKETKSQSAVTVDRSISPLHGSIDSTSFSTSRGSGFTIYGLRNTRAIEFIPIVSQLPGYPGLLAVSNLYLLYYYKGKGMCFLASNIRGGV